MFYYDPNDPRIFVPKRIGVGWTLNFAHPVSWVIAAVTVLAILGVYYLERRK